MNYTQVRGEAVGEGSPRGYGIVAYKVNVDDLGLVSSPEDRLQLGETVVMMPGGDTGEVTYISYADGVIWLRPESLRPMAYVVEKGIPIPEGYTPNKYPFRQMEVGDSFAAPRSEARRIENASSWYERRYGWKFRRRRKGDQVRIWRVA